MSQDGHATMAWVNPAGTSTSNTALQALHAWRTVTGCGEGGGDGALVVEAGAETTPSGNATPPWTSCVSDDAFALAGTAPAAG